MAGIITDVCAVALGGLIGALLGGRLSPRCRERLNQVFGVCAMGMGISSIVLMENLPAVVLSAVLGTATGLLLRLEERIQAGGRHMEGALRRLLRQDGDGSAERLALLETALVLFCASGTGIYGCLDAGMTGSVTVLMAKSVLDFFTALIFAGTAGPAIGLIAAPQFCVFTLLYLAAGWIGPLATPVMVQDFKAVGGLLLLATGCRIAKLGQFPVGDMIPAMCAAMPLSWGWTNLIVPLL